jgi:rubrerythrin
MDPSLSQALHLLNGTTVNNKIKQGKLVERLVSEKKTHDQILDEIYQRCFSRLPTEKERVAIQQEISTQENKTQALEDIFWALLNSREFVFNH